jgi:hypothetical protein
MKHVVQFSTGMSSAEVAWRLVERYGRNNVVGLTADTREEHPDNWRFAHQGHGRLGFEWVILADGRTPMEVGRDRKVVPNNRMAVCSQILKRELLRAYIDVHFDPDDSVMYVGYDWSEPHRIEAARVPWAPYKVEFPLADPPYYMKGDSDLQQVFRERGIEPPELYRRGFGHANCGGACVRGGQADWERLYRTDPTRYARWEAEEQKSRVFLGKNVAILRDRRGGKTKPLTLETFREQLERQPDLFDADDWGACGCFMDGELPPTEDGDR